MSEDIFETPSSTPNFQTELAEQLAQLVPEVIADGKIDVLKLEELLAQDAADKSERFGLFWPGKQRALRVAQMPTSATLRPEPGQSKEWDTTKNIFIEGDNLEVLKILQKHYHGKIKMIYIDPPYNTGKDFVYPDNFKEGVGNYLEWTLQVNEQGKKLSTNSESAGRYHSNWLNMMYPRLKLARNLLSDDGVIFMSIDDHEIDNLTRLAKEIFGEDNFLACFPRVTKRAGKSGDLIASNHDYVLALARGSGVRLNRFSHTDDGFKHSDQHLETRGKYKLNQTLDYDTLGYVKSLDYPLEIEGLIYYPGGVSAEAHEARREKNPKDGFRWRWSKRLFEFGLKEDFVVVKEGKNGPRIYTKTYQNASIKQSENEYEVVLQDRTKATTTLDLTDNKYSNDNAKKDLKILFDFAAFDYTKPVELLKLLVSISTDKDGQDIVLDFFAGSATTAHAVMQLNSEDQGNRQFIQVQLPEPTPEDSLAFEANYRTIAEISRERITRSGDRIQDLMDGKLGTGDVPSDFGYRSYSLTDTNFEKWQINSNVDRTVLEQHLFELRGNADDSSSELDLLVEVLVKQGHSLTDSIRKVKFCSLEMFSIGEDLIFAYLKENVKPTLTEMQAVLQGSPSKLIVLEDAFHGDDELKTNVAQLCKSKNIEFWTA
jgi:adenine-specific DNA-methyltransferase